MPDSAVRLQARPIYKIAREILTDWKFPSIGAVPYIAALRNIDRITDSYGYDSGRSVVAYFLANAGTWRGDVARRIKKELKALI